MHHSAARVLPGHGRPELPRHRDDQAEQEVLQRDRDPLRAQGGGQVRDGPGRVHRSALPQDP